MTPSTPTYHWLGAGLSSTAGLKLLAQTGEPLVIWNRTPEKVTQIVNPAIHSSIQVRPLDFGRLQQELNAGDTVISMLPASLHPKVAAICLEKKSHLITASYLSDAMRGFAQEASDAGLCFINEVGLDPGIDHLLAFDAVEQFQQTPQWRDPNARIEFLSLCGGLSETPNPFRYRFSWSPLGVLKALLTPAQFIENQTPKTTPQPWTSVRQVSIENESFEAYPNRDSIPFISEYNLEPVQDRLDTFIRGSLRLSGWTHAWQPIFNQIPGSSESQLQQLSDQLWKEHALPDDENDRVVLFVSLKSASDRDGCWHWNGQIDHVGDAKDSAMARLVSLPVAFTAQWLRLESRAPGVHTAPKEISFRKQLLACLCQAGISIKQQTSWSPA